MTLFTPQPFNYVDHFENWWNYSLRPHESKTLRNSAKEHRETFSKNIKMSSLFEEERKMSSPDHSLINNALNCTLEVLLNIEICTARQTRNGEGRTFQPILMYDRELLQPIQHTFSK